MCHAQECIILRLTRLGLLRRMGHKRERWLTEAESEVCCFLELSVREPRPMLDCLLTVAGLLALGASTSVVFLRRRALWRCSRARQLRLSPSKDVRS